MRAAKGNPDLYVKAILNQNANLLVPHYLMASWLYYVADRPLISDALFDEICKRLYAEWGTIEHYHKPAVDHEALIAGTGFYLQYPPIIPGAAMALCRMFKR